MWLKFAREQLKKNEVKKIKELLSVLSTEGQQNSEGKDTLIRLITEVMPINTVSELMALSVKVKASE